MFDRLLKTKKIDMYILGEVIKPFIGTAALVFFVLFMFQTLRLADFLIVRKIPAAAVGKIAVFMLISFSPLVFPVAFLTSILIGFGRMSADSEIIAIKSVGISLDQMSKPILTFSIMITLFSLLLNLEVAPWGERSLTENIYKAGSTKVVSTIQAGTFTSGFFDMLLFTEKVDPATGKMKNVFIFDEREAHFPMIVVSKSADLIEIDKKSTFGKEVVMQLHSGNLHKQDVDQGFYERGDFDLYSLHLKIDEFKNVDNNRPRMRSYRDLIHHMKYDDPKSQHFRDVYTELLKRITTSFSPIFFVFLGIGFGVVRTRAVQSRGMIITFLTMLVYWETLMFSIWASTQDKLHPLIGMSLPSLVIGIAGYIAFRRSRW